MPKAAAANGKSDHIEVVLIRIARALERLADAWENRPTKRKLF